MMFQVTGEEHPRMMNKAQTMMMASIWPKIKVASTCDFQQSGILTSVDSDEPLQPPFKLRNAKWCSVSSLTIINYSSD